MGARRAGDKLIKFTWPKDVGRWRENRQKKGEKVFTCAGEKEKLARLSGVGLRKKARTGFAGLAVSKRKNQQTTGK